MTDLELERALAEHDDLIVRCARGELPLRAFLASYDTFYRRWALDGHEGPIPARLAHRVEPHQRVWDEIETRITTEEFAADPRYAAAGFIGEEEALRRLRAIALACGLTGVE